MNDLPLVSIILPTYNRANLVGNAIGSVIAQAYINWELIVWDDGSEDGTKEVVRSFNDSRIRFYSDTNHGKSYALNQAIKRTKADYIAFLDDDDEWIEPKLTLQMEIMLVHHEIDLVFGNFLNLNKVTGEEGIGFDQNSDVMKFLGNQKLSEDTFMIKDNFMKCMALSNFIAFDSVIIRREILKKVGPFNESLRNGEDSEYWWRFALSGGKPAFTNKVVLKRIKYPFSLSGSGITTFCNHIMNLDSCSNEARLKNRPDLIPLLNIGYRNAWQNMITEYGRLGKTSDAVNAFKRSMKYGFSLGSFRLLFDVFLKLTDIHNEKGTQH